MANNEVRSRWEVAVEILHLLGEKEMMPDELNEKLVELFEVTDEELILKHPSGQRVFFDSDVGHAKRELKEAGLIDYGGDRKRRPARITDLGRAVLAENPSIIDAEFLKSYKEKNRHSEGELTIPKKLFEKGQLGAKRRTMRRIIAIWIKATLLSGSRS